MSEDNVYVLDGETAKVLADTVESEHTKEREIITKKHKRSLRERVLSEQAGQYVTRTYGVTNSGKVYITPPVQDIGKVKWAWIDEAQTMKIAPPVQDIGTSEVDCLAATRYIERPCRAVKEYTRRFKDGLHVFVRIIRGCKYELYEHEEDEDDL